MSSTPSTSTGPKFHFGLILGIATGAVIAGAACFYWVKAANAPLNRHEKIAILTWNQAPFWDPVEKGATEAAKDMGIDLTFVRSEPDVDSQNRHIQELLDSGIGALAICPNNPTRQKDILNQAAGKVILTTFDSDAPNTQRRGYAGTNNYEAGQVAGAQVRDAIPDGGQVLVCVGSIDQTSGRDRRQGLIDNLLDRHFEEVHIYDAIDAPLQGDKYQIVKTVTDGGDTNQCLDLLQDAIKANPDLKCIVGLNGYSGDVAVKAVAAAGKQGQIKIIGFDESAQEQADVASGAIYSSIIQSQYVCGYETVRMLDDCLRDAGQNAPAHARLIEFPVSVMKANNMQTMREQGSIRTPDTTMPTTMP
jgi:ribose transport system substrate-binding protein